MSKIKKILDMFDINGNNECGGTDKDTNHSYAEIYEQFLEPILEKDGSLLEIGIRYGCSIVLWNELLKNSRIFGIDNQDILYDNIREYVKDYPKKITLEFRDAYCKETIDHIKFIYPRGFDIIIDDGSHTEESQLKCIELYLELLKDDGVLVIEDIQNFNSIEVFIKNIPKSKFFDYEPLVFDLRDKKNRYDDIIFAIKKKVKKSTSKIAVFYHVGQFGNWERLFQEQINSLVISGLYHICDFIHIGVNGDKILPVLLPKFKVEYNSNKILEADTLKSLYDFCINNKEHRVLYFHTKGATQGNTPHILNVNKWRYYLEYFAFHRWKDCVTSLEEYDTSGSEYAFQSGLTNQDTGITEWEQNPHYSGNYWWANASYISTLDPNYLYRTDKGWDRYRSEFWIGTGNPNYYQFYNTSISCKYNDWGSLISPDYVKKEEFIEPLLFKKMKTEIDLILMKNEDKIKKMQEITTAWTDHVIFTQWLVNRINPKVIVDLGVDYGYSSFSFAIPQIGHVYGIDCFEGDYNTGIRNTLDSVNESKKNLELDNITFIKGYFDEIAKVWDKPIDILHIDGSHTYEAVKNDYKTWSKFLNDDGIILFHDTMVEDENFGVKKFFEEIDLPKVNFTCSFGLGVVSKNIDLIKEISDTFNLSLKEEFIKPLLLKKMNTKKTKIVMISMFKNESKGIRRMLESIYKYIDFYVLQDNGSTDGTPQIVEEFFADKNIPGFVYKVEEGWIGFGWNRDHLLQKTLSTDHGCDWIMKMDCDEYLEVDDDFDWSVFNNTDTESFHVTAQNPGCIYYRAWIWKAKLPWKFQHDHTHEIIYLEDKGQNYTICNLPKSFRMIGTNDGESYTIRTKYISDALKLEETMIREETMLSDLYHFWYIGKSYADCYGGDFYPLGKAHSEEFARRSIFYFQEYLKFLQPEGIHETAYFTCCSIGQTYRYLNQYDLAIEWINKAESFCPVRNEHLVYLAEIYRDLKLFEKMYEQTEKLVQPDRILPFPDYYFLINTDFYIDSGIYPLTLHNFAMAMLNKMPSFYGIRNLFDKEAQIKGIEIGCLYGDTTQYLLDYFPNLQLIGIDPYEDYSDWNHELKNREKEIDILAQKVNQHKDRFALLKTSSDKAHPFLADNSFDFVFIDGLHTHDQVLIDCKNYYSKLKQGGILAGHDYYVIEEVRNAVNEFAKECNILTIKHTDRDVWYWAKP